MLNEIGMEFGMKINVKKTKGMLVSKTVNERHVKQLTDAEEIEQVSSFTYLGLINDEARCDTEIQR
jgi:hypothetical protein